MKYILLPILMFILFSNLCFAQPFKKSIDIGYYSLPPHSMNIQEAPAGAAISYLQENIFPESEYTISWKFLPFARVLSELRAGRIDCAILIAKTTQREQEFKYPDNYLYQTKNGLIVLKNRQLTEVVSLDQLKGMRLGHVVGSVRPTELGQLGVVFENISGKDFTRRNIKKLEKNRIDAVYVPTLSHAKYEYGKMGDRSDVNFLPLPMIEGHKLYVVFRKDIPESILNDFNAHSEQHFDEYLSYLQKQ
tara:strand:+ start:262 stop:1005 length:744 start_codon:yes stop_codon:yes gene_type:complete